MDRVNTLCYFVDKPCSARPSAGEKRARELPRLSLPSGGQLDVDRVSDDWISRLVCRGPKAFEMPDYVGLGQLENMNEPTKLRVLPQSWSCHRQAPILAIADSRRVCSIIGDAPNLLRNWPIAHAALRPDALASA